MTSFSLDYEVGLQMTILPEGSIERFFSNIITFIRTFKTNPCDENWNKLMWKFEIQYNILNENLSYLMRDLNIHRAQSQTINYMTRMDLQKNYSS